MPSDLSVLKDPLDSDLDLAKQALSKIQEAGSQSVTADQGTETTIYDLEEFWIVRDCPPYLV